MRVHGACVHSLTARNRKGCHIFAFETFCSSGFGSVVDGRPKHSDGYLNVGVERAEPIDKCILTAKQVSVDPNRGKQHCVFADFSERKHRSFLSHMCEALFTRQTDALAHQVVAFPR